MADQFNVLDQPRVEGEFLLDGGGESAINRVLATTDTAGDSSGVLVVTFFTAKRTEPITQVRMRSGGTAAAPTPTLVRIGIWTADAAGNLLSLVGSTPNDTALFAATGTTYTKALSATWAKQAGQRYAAGPLIVSAAAIPSLGGFGGFATAGGQLALADAPRISGRITSLSDLPASGLTGNTSRIFQVLFLP